MTVAPPCLRSHLVPALIGAVLLCLLLASPATAKPSSPGQAKKSSPPPGQAKKSTPLGQVKKSSPPPGQAKKSIPAPTPVAPAPQPAPGDRRRATRATANARKAPPRAATRRRAAARRRATAVGFARGAAALAAATSSSTPARRDDKRNQPQDERRPSSPLTTEEQLPQPLRVVRDIVEVVPTPLRVLVAGLVALSVLLGSASALALLRNRRLARQRRELLGQVGLLQAALLPELPEKVGACRASVAYRPADGPGAGGDFYDVLALGPGRAAVIMGDVSGHGRAALGRTALARYTLRAYVEAGLEPREALQIAGSVLAGKLQGDFVTALVAIHDGGAGTLTYASAGHPPPVVISSPGFEPILAGSAPPLGVGAATGQRQTTLPFPRGSIACYYTDGLSEARTSDGQLGTARLERLIRGLGPDVTADQVIDRVAACAGAIADDAAACVIAAEEGATIVRSRLERLELTRSELRGSMLRDFLDACGVAANVARVAERDAGELAHRAGGVILEVRLGDRAQVEIRPPDLSLGDGLTVTLA